MENSTFLVCFQLTNGAADYIIVRYECERNDPHDHPPRQPHLLLSARLLCGYAALRPDASCLSFLSGLRAAPSRMSRTAEGARRTFCRPFVFPFYRRRLS